MASADGLRVRHLLARGVVQQVGTDTPVAIRFRHKGAAAQAYLLGNSTTTYNITNPSGTTFTYTYTGAGVDPMIGSIVSIGTVLLINGGNFNALNNGTFTVTAVTPTSFSIVNAAGVVQSGVTLSTGSILTQPVTSIVIDNSANTLVLVDSNGTTTISLSAAATDTVGELSNAINATGSWEAKVLDALRTDSVNDGLVTGTVVASRDEDGELVFDLHVDTSAVKQLATCLTFSRTFGRTDKAAGGHALKLRQARYFATLGAAAANNFVVVKRHMMSGEETVIYSALSVSATDTKEIDLTAAEGCFISTDAPHELIVLVKDSTSLADAAANFLRLIGTVE